VENPNSYPNSVKAGKTRQIGFGSGRVPAGMGFVVMPGWIAFDVSAASLVLLGRPLIVLPHQKE